MSNDFKEGGGDVADFTSYRCSTYKVRENHSVNSSGESPHSFDENITTYDSYYTETFRPQSQDSDKEDSKDLKKRLTECMLTKGRSVSYKQYMLESAKYRQSSREEMARTTVEEVYVNVEGNLKDSTESSDDDESESDEDQDDEDLVDKESQANENEQLSIGNNLNQARVEVRTGTGEAVVPAKNDSENDGGDGFDSDDSKTNRHLNDRNITAKNSSITKKRYLNPAVYMEDTDAKSVDSQASENEQLSIGKNSSDFDQTRVDEDTTGTDKTVVPVKNDVENDGGDGFDSDDSKNYGQFNDRNITAKNSPTTNKRYLNPAVYLEDVDENSVDSNSAASVYSSDHTTIVQSLRSSSTPFMLGKIGSPRLGAGSDTFRLSVTSRSTNATAKEQRERDEERKRIAFEQWLIKKEQERKEQKRLEMLKNNTPTPQSTPEQRDESYKRWLQRKKIEAERRRVEESTKRTRKEREQREAMRKEREKTERLEEWLKQKEETHKVTKEREEMKQALLAAEQEKRRTAGEQAFRDWLRTSKAKPLPVPLNQGERSMRGTASDLYVNPVEWQSA